MQRRSLLLLLLWLAVTIGFAQSLQQYEYWVDNGYGGRVTRQGSSTDVSLTFEGNGLRPGLHYFNVRAQNDRGLWGPLKRDFFYIPQSNEEPQTNARSYEYWLDNAYEQKTVTASTDDAVVLTFDGSGLRPGLHYFNVRAQNDRGLWGPLKRDFFYIPNKEDVAGGSLITGYEYFFGSETTYVPISPTDAFELSNSMIDLPSLGSFSSLEEGCTWTFNGDSVKLNRANVLPFGIRFLNENGEWSVSATDDLHVSDSILKTTKALSPEQQLVLTKPAKGSFEAIAITVDATRAYYLLATQSCKMHLFRADGTLIRTISSEQMLQCEEISLQAGTYYGIVYDAVVDDSNPGGTMNILLTLEANRSLPPTVTYENEMVTITTELDDAEIRYTLDGTQPTVQSTPYTQPFALRHNAIIQAIAVQEGKTPSTVATYVVDNYTAEKVTFSADGYMLTMETVTDSASIHYTLDGSEPTSESTRYTEPIALSGSCTVKAIAARTGYNSSEVATFEFVASTVTVATPGIAHEGNIVTMVTATPEASVFYTLDGSVPSAESILYEGPFEAVENGTIKAIALRKNYYESQVTEMVVDWFKVANVTFETDGYMLTMTSATPGATIYYTIDGSTPTAESVKYAGAVMLTNACTVNAIAMKANFHNSEVTYLNFQPGVVTAATPQIQRDGNFINISSATVGASIYYTTDGSEPTTASTLFTNSFVVTQNCVIKAIAVKESFFSSSVAMLTVDWFKVTDVTFGVNGNLLSMSTTTENATIYYTIDGTTPTMESVKYVAPITLTGDCTVKAMAAKDGYTNSDVTAYSFSLSEAVTASPKMSHDGNRITLTTDTPDADIYYTLNGSRPTATSTRYEAPFEVTRNLTLMAVAMRQNYLDSEVMEWEIDWFNVSEVEFSYTQTDEGIWLTLSTETPDASIYYGVGEDAELLTLYENPILLKDNRPVSAVARRDGYHDSEVTVFRHGGMSCPDVAISYDGHYVTLNSAEDASIYYTLDGSEPTEVSLTYDEPVAVSKLGMVKAFAHKEYLKDSPVSTMELTYVYDGEHAEVKAENLLAKAFEWCGTEAVQTLDIAGVLGAEDYALIRTLPALDVLKMEQVTLPDGVLADSLLAGARMRWFASPASVSRVGVGVLANCERLAAVTWNSATTRLEASAFGEKRNPNMLYYVKSVSMMGIDSVNVVSGGLSSGIALYDGDGYSDFYCPETFRAESVSYTHEYGMQTMEGVCRGWETLALPFTVQTIRHENKGELVPFVRWKQGQNSQKPFWLGSLSERGFVSDSVIRANVPYIISMPNNDAYADRYILKGKVTFSAKDVMIEATDEESCQQVMGDVAFIPAFGHKKPSESVYALNLYSVYDNHPEGSIFLHNYREVRPFEAYTTSMQQARRPFISIEELSTEDTATAISAASRINKNEKIKSNRYYNLQGQRVDEPKRKGVYLLHGKKVVKR